MTVSYYKKTAISKSRRRFLEILFGILLVKEVSIILSRMAFVFRRLAPVASALRSFHATPAACEMSEMDKFNFKACQYRKYGLLKDDLLTDLDPHVAEALKRIPEEMLMKRIYRSIKAQQLYLEHNILPKEEWTKIDDDHEYLQPYLREIEAEEAERDAWESTH